MAGLPRKLTELLEEADAPDATPAVDAAELARRVRQTVQRRRVRRATAGAGVALSVMAVCALALWRPWSSPAPLARDPLPARLSPAEVEAARAELSALREESGRREALVARLLAGERRRVAAAELRDVSAAPDAVQRLRFEQDRAALVLIQQADSLSRSAGHMGSAAHGYRRVVELFPRSQWAAVARRRLDELPG